MYMYLSLQSLLSLSLYYTLSIARAHENISRGISTSVQLPLVPLNTCDVFFFRGAIADHSHETVDLPSPPPLLVTRMSCRSKSSRWEWAGAAVRWVSLPQETTASSHRGGTPDTPAACTPPFSLLRLRILWWNHCVTGNLGGPFLTGNLGGPFLTGNLGGPFLTGNLGGTVFNLGGAVFNRQFRGTVFNRQLGGIVFNRQFRGDHF